MVRRTEHSLTYRRLSAEEMNKIILEKVPLKERLRAVYLPIIAMDCACYLAEDLLTLMATLRLDITKKISRTIRSCVEGYRNDNWRVMRSDLYKSLSNATKEFYTSLSRDMIIYQIQYQQAMLDRKLPLKTQIAKMVAMSYIIRELVRFVVTLDRDFSKRVSDLLGKDVNYATEDNRYCLEIDKALNELLSIFGVPHDLSTYQTDMAFKVFKNKLYAIEV